MLGDHRPRGRGADHEGSAFLANADQARDALKIDDPSGLDPAGTHLNEQVGAAGQHLRRPGAQGRYGLVRALGCDVVIQFRQAPSSRLDPGGLDHPVIG